MNDNFNSFYLLKQWIYNYFDANSSNNANYSTFVETKLVEITKKTNNIKWNMNYSISGWTRSWDNETFNVKLKGRNGSKFNEKHKGDENTWPVNARIFKVQLPYVLREYSNSKETTKYYADYFAEELKDKLQVEYYYNFKYASAVKHNNNNNDNDNKYDYFDGPGYGYGLHLMGSFKTIKESADEVEFQIKLPPVKNKSPEHSSSINNGNVTGQTIYYTGGYIIAWANDNDNGNGDEKTTNHPHLMNYENEEKKCSEKCNCVEEWKKQIEEGMKEELKKLPTLEHSVFNFFIKHNDGTKDNDPINHPNKK